MTKPPSPRPLSITVIANFHVLMGAIGIGGLPYILARRGFLAVHNVQRFESQSGWPELLFLVFLTAMSLYFGIGLRHLWETTRRVAIGVYLLLILLVLRSIIRDPSLVVSGGIAK